MFERTCESVWRVTADVVMIRKNVRKVKSSAIKMRSLSERHGSIAEDEEGGISLRWLDVLGGGYCFGLSFAGFTLC